MAGSRRRNEMRPAGWIFLLTSLSFVWALTLWCFYKVLSIHDER